MRRSVEECGVKGYRNGKLWPGRWLGRVEDVVAWRGVLGGALRVV